jgi:hypothetical protein
MTADPRDDPDYQRWLAERAAADPAVTEPELPAEQEPDPEQGPEPAAEPEPARPLYADDLAPRHWRSAPGLAGSSAEPVPDEDAAVTVPARAVGGQAELGAAVSN